MVYVLIFLFIIYYTQDKCLEPTPRQNHFSENKSFTTVCIRRSHSLSPTLLPIKIKTQITKTHLVHLKNSPPPFFPLQFQHVFEADIGQCDIIHVSRCDSLDQQIVSTDGLNRRCDQLPVEASTRDQINRADR